MKPRKDHPYLNALPPLASPPTNSVRNNGNLAINNRVVLSNAVPLVERVTETAPTKPSRVAGLRLYFTLMKPITWVPVVWSFWCGAGGAGGLSWDLSGLLHLIIGLILSGPLLCGMSQAINDYFDREVDAVNEPWRPIPSGRMTLLQTYQLIAGLGFLGLLAAYYLGQTVLLLSLAGIAMAHAYSAPPIRLKAFTWLGPLTSAISYILLPWLAAASIFGGITWQGLLIALIYTGGAVGIMISNDFKSIRGDYALKLPSVPVVFGTKKAAQLACGFMDGAQILIILLLSIEGRWLAAGLIVLLLLPQLWLQRYFIEKPLARAIWYNARGQNFFVLGMLIAAFVM